MNGSMQHLDNGRWRVRWRDPDGRNRSRTFDQDTDATKWLGYVRHKTSVDQLPLPATATVGQWAGQWLQGKRSTVRAGTWIDYESTVRNHLPSSWHGVALDAVARSTAQRVISGIAAAGKPSQARKTRAVLGSMFNDAVAEGLCRANPFARVRVPSNGSGHRSGVGLGVRSARVRRMCGGSRRRRRRGLRR